MYNNIKSLINTFTLQVITILPNYYFLVTDFEKFIYTYNNQSLLILITKISMIYRNIGEITWRENSDQLIAFGIKLLTSNFYT